jgi:hypothetical protein
MLGAVVFGLPIVWCVLCVLVVCAPAIPALAVVVVRVVKPHGRRRYGSTRADRWR